MFENTQNIDKNMEKNVPLQKEDEKNEKSESKEKGSLSPEKEKKMNKKSLFIPIKIVEKKDKKKGLILPNISKSQGIIKKNCKNFIQRAQDKIRISLNNTKFKVKNAFVQNEEEEKLKRSRY